MHLTSVRRGRRRATALAAGAVAVSLSACGTFGGEESESSTSTYEPVETTSTSEPSTSSSSTTEGDPQPDPPDGTALLNQSKQHMSVMSTVTIDGTLSIAKGNDRVPAKLHSEGSTGNITSQESHAGASRTSLTLQNGGTLEVHAQGWYHYLRANEKWFEGLGREDRQVSEYAGRWLKVKRDESPDAIDGLRPNTLIKGTFFGESLTPFQAERASSSTVRLDGEWVARLDLQSEEDKQQTARTMWVSLDPEAPNMLRLTYGESPTRTTFTFSGWNETDDQFTEPKRAKTLTDKMLKSIL